MENGNGKDGEGVIRATTTTTVAAFYCHFNIVIQILIL
jgi:hypothetical protein